MKDLKPNQLAALKMMALEGAISTSVAKPLSDRIWREQLQNEPFWPEDLRELATAIHEIDIAYGKWKKEKYNARGGPPEAFDLTFVRHGGKEEFDKEHKRRWNEQGGDWDGFHAAITNN